MTLKYVISKEHLTIIIWYSSLAPTGLVVSVKMVHGELEQATKENPLLLKNVCVTKKLGFSDVIMPGDVRYGMEISPYLSECDNLFIYNLVFYAISIIVDLKQRSHP